MKGDLHLIPPSSSLHPRCASTTKGRCRRQSGILSPNPSPCIVGRRRQKPNKVGCSYSHKEKIVDEVSRKVRSKITSDYHFGIQASDKILGVIQHPSSAE
jgi:hypothetical protein